MSEVSESMRALNRHKKLAEDPQAPDDSLAGLQFLWLEITPGCNLHCRHCYTESSPSLKDPKIVDWDRVLIDAHALGCRQVQFIGGEPTYHRDLGQYIATARSLGYEFIEVYTNLTLVNDRLADQFQKFGVQLATSFYSTQKDLHDSVTGVRGSFEKTVSGIRCALSKQIPLRVGITSMQQNKNNIAACIEFLVQLGIARSNINVDHTRPVGRALNLVRPQTLEETLCGDCWRGKLAVSWDGTCYPCIFARRVSLGTLADSGLSQIVHSARLLEFRTRIRHHSAQRMRSSEQEELVPQLFQFLSRIGSALQAIH
jgi:MoaA/NifB/PqqE/SkfB family radical SAM enzyme